MGQVAGLSGSGSTMVGVGGGIDEEAGGGGEAGFSAAAAAGGVTAWSFLSAVMARYNT